jgi:hypothetical protein
LTWNGKLPLVCIGTGLGWSAPPDLLRLGHVRQATTARALYGAVNFVLK